MYLYEADECPKRKHHWGEPHAGFVVLRGVRIGKCPSGMDLHAAQTLLNAGLSWSPTTWRKPYPKRIYSVHQGVVYRATPTRPGTSYHGFPEDPGVLPPEMKQPLLDLAEQQGCLEEVRKWLSG